MRSIFLRHSAAFSCAVGALTLAGCAAPVDDASATPAPAKESTDGVPRCPGCGGIQIDWVAPPTSLARTMNPQDCAAHTPAPANLFAGLACEGAMLNGDIALIWNWADVGATSSDVDLGPPDGFHVYASLSGGSLQLWGAQRMSGATTLALPTNPTGGQICYRAAAYKGSVESSLSNPVCVTAAGTPTKTISLLPREMKTCSLDYDDNGNYFVTSPQTPPPGDFEVGYGALITSDLLNGNITSYWDAEGAFLFDTSAFTGHTILSASIAFTDQGTSNCTNRVALSSVDWIGNAEWCTNAIPVAGQDIATDFTPAQAARGLDATNAVREWASGETPNLGVLVTPNDPFQDKENCNANYSAPILTVTYFP